MVTNKRLERPVAECDVRTVDGKPILRWKDLGAEHYVTYRATEKSGPYSRMLTTEKLSYINTSAVAGKTYYYKIRAVYANGSGLLSSIYENTATCGQPEIEKGNNSSGLPTLKWDPAEGAAKYEVYRSEDGKDYVKALTTTGTSYTNTSAEEGITYYYKVRGITSNGLTGAYSDVVTNKRL